MSEIIRLRLLIAYDGSGFHGWARQSSPPLRTVQGELEDALSLILRVPVELTVAGRTDAGVHATGQVAHCDVPRECLNQRSIDGDPRRLVRRLARFLDDDLIVRDVNFAPKGFDARFSALRRTYTYRLCTDAAGVLPTRRADTAWWPRDISLPLMQAAADQLTGLHDFAALCKARPHATTVRELQGFQWREVSTPDEPNVFEAEVIADAFCWNMVRSLVGCCLVIGEEKKPLSFAGELLNQNSRSSQVPVAPANGLTLRGVDYPAEGELARRQEETRARRNLS